MKHKIFWRLCYFQYFPLYFHWWTKIESFFPSSIHCPLNLPVLFCHLCGVFLLQFFSEWCSLVKSYWPFVTNKLKGGLREQSEWQTQNAGKEFLASCLSARNKWSRWGQRLTSRDCLSQIMLSFGGKLTLGVEPPTRQVSLPRTHLGFYWNDRVWRGVYNEKLKELAIWQKSEMGFYRGTLREKQVPYKIGWYTSCRAVILAMQIWWLAGGCVDLCPNTGSHVGVTWTKNWVEFDGMAGKTLNKTYLKNYLFLKDVFC